MAKSESTKINDVDVAMAVIAHEAVDCFCGTEELQSAQSGELVSCTGGTFHATEGENWPRAADGEPLIPWLQIVCTEMKNLDGAFCNRKSVSFFIRQDFDGYEATSTSDGSDFVVREYSLAAELMPLARPSEMGGTRFTEVDRKYFLTVGRRVDSCSVDRKLQQWRTFGFQRQQVGLFVIALLVFPASVHDADPFVSQ